MGKPAARLGDTTVHGGVITVGCPTVMIGGAPAARLTDMHTCPMQTPAGPAPIPHVGGPIVGPGAPTVLIGGMPAAVVGDMVTCVGPPDTIAPPGCPTVLIGMGGGGGGGGGMGGSGNAASESGAQEGNEGSVEEESSESDTDTEEDHFLDVSVLDRGGFPIANVGYQIESPDGQEEQGRLFGNVTRTGVAAGNHRVTLRAITSAVWSAARARNGETVKMQAETAGVEDGTELTFRIFKRDANRADLLAHELTHVVQQGKAEPEWSYEHTEEANSQSDTTPGFSSPSFYFTVSGDELYARSSLLDYRDFVEIELLDDEGNPMKDEPYIVSFSNGEVREGTLDSNGRAREENAPAATHRVSFPNHPEITRAEAE